MKILKMSTTDFTQIPVGVVYPLPTFERKSADKSTKRTLMEACGRISSERSEKERDLLRYIPSPPAKYWRDDIEVVKTLSMKDISQDCLRYVTHTKNGNIWITDKDTAYQIKDDGILAKKISISTDKNFKINSLCSDVNGYLIIFHFCVGKCSVPDFIRNVETGTSLSIQTSEIHSGICLVDDNVVALVFAASIKGSTLKLKFYNGNAEETLVTLDKQLTSLLLSKTPFLSRICPCCLRFNPSNRQVVISNSKKGIVVGSSLEGKYQFQYDGKHHGLAEEFGPLSIECDHYGHVLIADPSNHSIHMLNKEGQFLTLIASKEQGLEQPYGLSIDKNGQMWVTNFSKITIKIIKYLEEEFTLTE